MVTRRGFLASMIAAGAAPKLGWGAAGSPAFIAAAQEPGGAHALYGLTTEGAATFRVPLPARGHAGAGHPRRAEAVAFARRPGTYALVIDCARGVETARLTPPPGRQFNGHGLYVDDGATLFTVEQVAEGAQGIIGVWDTVTWTRIGEFSTGEIGPHDARLLPGGEVLVVANGGIETDAGDRTKLNIPTMRPSLAYFDLDGRMLDEVRLDDDLHQNSIRHLALRDDGLVGFAMQWEGEADMAMPLVGLHRMGGAVTLAEAPLADELAMKGYAGSIAWSADGAELAITSPKGGRIHRFDAAGAFLGARSRADVCGLVTHPEGLMASDGFGGIIALSGADARGLARHELAWDNHIVVLEV